MASSPSGARRPRMNQDELRALVLEAGLAELDEHGPASGASHLTFKRVFERIEADGGPRLTNAQVYQRIWPSAEAYQVDVLAEMLRRAGSVVFQQTVEATVAALRDADLSTRAGRRQAFVQAIRHGGRANAEAVAATATKRAHYLGTWALAAAQPDGSGDDILEVVRQIHRDNGEDLDVAWAQLLELFGLCMREGVTLHQFTTATLVLAEGYLLRSLVDPEAVRPMQRPTGPGGELEAWHPFAAALEALATAYTEPIPGRRRRS